MKSMLIKLEGWTLRQSNRRLVAIVIIADVLGVAAGIGAGVLLKAIF